MQMDKNPFIKFTKLFREPILQKLFAWGVAEFSVFLVTLESNNQSATHLMDGKAGWAAGSSASFLQPFFFQKKKKVDRSPFPKEKIL